MKRRVGQTRDGRAVPPVEALRIERIEVSVPNRALGYSTAEAKPIPVSLPRVRFMERA